MRHVSRISALSAAVAAALASAAPPATGVTAVPPEERAVVLPVAPTYQALAVDVDADGSRELARLIRAADTSIELEIWRQDGPDWEPLEPVQVLPAPTVTAPEGGVYGEAAFRMLAWHEAGRERLIIATQPHFELLDRGQACCLQLERVTVDGTTVALEAVAEGSFAVDGLLAIDLDGDRTDELLATVRPEPDSLTDRLAVRVHRWQGAGFGPPESREFVEERGGPPFVLGDADGEPGAEAGLLVGADSSLVRLSLDGDDGLLLEASGIRTVRTAAAAGVSGWRGLVTLHPHELVSWRWPRGEQAIHESIAPASDAWTLAGVLQTDETASVVLAVGEEGHGIRVLAVPGLEEAEASPRAGRSLVRDAGLPLVPFIGRLPAGDPPAIALGASLPDGEPAAALINAVPLGRVGDGSWMALGHATVLPPASDLAREGGALFRPGLIPGAWQAIVPAAMVLTPEADAGRLEPAVTALAVDGRPPIHWVGVGALGVQFSAPPGSRIRLHGVEGGGLPQVVPPNGRVLGALRPAPGEEAGPVEVRVVVLTPAGHAYLARWDVQRLTDPLPLEAAATTRLGSLDVAVSGRTIPVAEVTVGGRSVPVDADGRYSTTLTLPPWPSSIRVVAADPAGHAAELQLTGIGLVDYRGIPLLPIAALLTGALALTLVLRTPGRRTTPVPIEEAPHIEDLDQPERR